MRSGRRTIRGFPESRLCLLSLLVVLLPLAFASARASTAQTACLAMAGADAPAVPVDWRTVVDVDAGWAVLLPPSHQLSRSGDTWYAFETLDGTPLVPDLSIQLHRDRGVEELAPELFGGTAVLEPVHMGPATLGYRASVGTAAGAEGYLVASGAGVYSIIRYEDFDWDGFDRVACSFHVVELVGGTEAGN